MQNGLTTVLVQDGLIAQAGASCGTALVCKGVDNTLFFLRRFIPDDSLCSSISKNVVSSIVFCILSNVYIKLHIHTIRSP